jgi:putative tryptophan/tyrosine transport system substrate-binding protein
VPIRRREFLAWTAAASISSHAAFAQQKARIPTVGVIMGVSPDDLQTKIRVQAFESAWPELGWVEGRNIHVDYRWADVDQMGAACAALVASAPDVILVNGISILTAMRAATTSIPVVFTGISDPEGVGLVASLAHPGGNMTGLANFEPSIGGKWLQTLKEIAPYLTRVGVFRVGKTHAGILQNVRLDAASSATEVVDCSVSDDASLRQAIGAFAGHPATGLIVLPDPFFSVHREAIFEMATKQRHPAIYPFRTFVEQGGLASYGIDILEQVRKSAFYVDKILKGARPGDLPVQAPTKFELVINLKVAKALGVDISPTLLARADDVIE